MGFLNSSQEFFGLDIGTTAIRLVELKGGSSPKGLLKYAYVPIDGKLSMSDSKADQQKLAEVIDELVKKAGPRTNNVSVGIPSNRVFTTVADIDRIPLKELAGAITYQADSLIPTPLNESKMDRALIGELPVDKAKLKILLTSVPNKSIEARLDMLESIGLNTVAFEPDNLAMARALAPADPGAHLIIDVGQVTTDLVVVINGIPHLTRNLPTGVDAIIKSAMQNLNVDEKQAEQFVFKFGLSDKKLEGQVFQAITPTVDLIASEIEKSIKFTQTRYSNSKIDRIITTGGAAIIPDFPTYLANKFSLQLEIGNAWRGVSYSADRQTELAAISNQFAVAVGLAERS